MNEDDDLIPEGVCTAIGCKCSHFKPRKNSAMYCGQPNCGHSVEWHHMNSREIDV
jgi:hypothetical protein